MDSQPTANQKAPDWRRLNMKVLLTALALLVLFLGTYIAAEFMGLALYGCQSCVTPGPVTERLGAFLRQPGGGFLFFLLAGFWLFPTGWLWLFSAFNDPASQAGANMPDSPLGCLLGLVMALMAYPVYFGIYLAATVAVFNKRRWIFVALYVIFVLLLLVNIRGCTFGGSWSGF